MKEKIERAVIFYNNKKILIYQIQQQKKRKLTFNI